MHCIYKPTPFDLTNSGLLLSVALQFKVYCIIIYTYKKIYNFMKNKKIDKLLCGKKMEKPARNALYMARILKYIYIYIYI